MAGRKFLLLALLGCLAGGAFAKPASSEKPTKKSGTTATPPKAAVTRAAATTSAALALPAKAQMPNGRLPLTVSDAKRRKRFAMRTVHSSTSPGRPLPRIGGLTKDQIKGEDGLR